MNHAFTKSLVIGVLIQLVVGILLHVLFFPLPIGVWVLVVIYPALTWLLFRMISGTRDKSPARFVATVNGTVIIKLMASAVIAGTYFYFNKETAKVFALALMAVYLVNTVVLTKSALGLMRQSNPKN